MKKIIILLLVLLVGCIENLPGGLVNEEENLTPEIQAQVLAMNYVKMTSEYTQNNGRNLQIGSVKKTDCDTCWEISLRYDIDSDKPNAVDRITINVEIENGKVFSTNSKQGVVPVLTPGECTTKLGRVVDLDSGDKCNKTENQIAEIEGKTTPHVCCTPKEHLSLREALQIAVNSECALEGSIVGYTEYNKITGSWWLDIDAKREGCNPVCVVREDTRVGVINWRCS